MRVVIAGGGTGGHLFPGVALAEAFMTLRPGSKVTFLGAERGLETSVIPALGFDLVTLPVGGLMGVGPVKGIYRGLLLALGVLRAASVLRRISPDLVVGTGGYSSVPGVIAAAMLRIQRSIMEQNVSPGRANRFLARFVPRVYLGFPVKDGVFAEGKVILAGNPIRKCALPQEDVEVLEGERGLTLLILGGSQGAAQLNNASLEIVPELLKTVEGLRVIHQTGGAHSEMVMERYREQGADVEVVPFMDSIGEFYSRADLCLSRAGAMAVSELAAAGVPSVLVPYPFAAGGHQRDNARWLAERGGAVIIDSASFSPQLLKEELSRLISSRDDLAVMAKKAKDAGRQDAADSIAKEEIMRITGEALQ